MVHGLVVLTCRLFPVCGFLQLAEFCTMSRLIGVNEKGHRVGEDHPQAVLTDAEVERLLTLHDEEGWGYSRLAKAFEISKSLAAQICRGEKRSHRPSRYKRV
jgi:hypothetical protein